jgi:hypothetical protein
LDLSPVVVCICVFCGLAILVVLFNTVLLLFISVSILTVGLPDPMGG